MFFATAVHKNWRRIGKCDGCAVPLLTGVHASYLTRLVVEGGPRLRAAAQRRISRRIVELLGA
jgi:hypothetical protein